MLVFLSTSLKWIATEETWTFLPKGGRYIPFVSLEEYNQRSNHGNIKCTVKLHWQYRGLNIGAIYVDELRFLLNIYR